MKSSNKKIKVGEKIELYVVFSQNITLKGSSFLSFKIDSKTKTATCKADSQILNRLLCSYLVTSNDSPGQISFLESSIEVKDGSIQGTDEIAFVPIIPKEVQRISSIDYPSLEVINDQQGETVVGEPSKLHFSLEPSDVIEGSLISPDVKVSVTDTLGNLVSDSAISITISIHTNPIGGNLAGTKTVNAINGVATFSDLTIDKIGSGYTLQATSTGLSGQSASFNVNAGSPGDLYSSVSTNFASDYRVYSLLMLPGGKTLLGGRKGVNPNFNPMIIRLLALGSSNIRSEMIPDRDFEELLASSQCGGLNKIRYL